MSNKHRGYDKRILVTFDVIGSYFVDVFYNALFLKAKDALKNSRAKSLTDAYRNNVTTFMRGIAENAKVYVELITKLHEYYTRNAGYHTNTLSEFEDRILSQFIPAEYYGDLTTQNKETAFHDIIVKAVNQLGEIVLEPRMLGRVIDDHQNSNNVLALQDALVDVFVTQREEYYSKFVDEISKTNGNSTVSKAAFKKLKTAFTDEMSKRIKAETDRDRAISMLQGSMKKISEQTAEIDRLVIEVRSLEDKLRRDSSTQGYFSTVDNEPNDQGLTLSSLNMSAAPTNAKKQMGKKPTNVTNVTNVTDVTQTTLRANKVGNNVPTVPNVPTVLTAKKSRAAKKKVSPVVSPVVSRIIDDNVTADNNNKDINDNVTADVIKDATADAATDESENQHESADTSSENESEDSEELHNRQRDALSKRFSLDVMDDPGFG